ncbi:hypothetical protein GGR57DRAFT_474769 [Xylariaceae sp. FL1272]|nr:hypothetical protein GGR57DRAFT_474769 [Xylariaceae sp. FL1272]
MVHRIRLSTVTVLSLFANGSVKFEYPVTQQLLKTFLSRTKQRYDLQRKFPNILLVFTMLTWSSILANTQFHFVSPKDASCSWLRA